MYPSGHIAVGYLFATGPALARRRLMDFERVMIPTVLGAVTPDLIDKPLRALEIATYGRSVGHSIFVFAVLVAIWSIVRRRGASWTRPFGWWLVGIGSHLLVDFANDAIRGLEARGFFFTAWAGWPVTDARDFQVLLEIGRHIRIHPSYTSLEIGVFAMVAAVATARWMQIRRGVGGLGGRRRL